MLWGLSRGDMHYLDPSVEKPAEAFGPVGMTNYNNHATVSPWVPRGPVGPWPEAVLPPACLAAHLYRLRSVNQSCTTITTWQTVKRKAAICSDCWEGWGGQRSDTSSSSQDAAQGAAQRASFCERHCVTCFLTGQP